MYDIVRWDHLDRLGLRDATSHNEEHDVVADQDKAQDTDNEEDKNGQRGVEVDSSHGEAEYTDNQATSDEEDSNFEPGSNDEEESVATCASRTCLADRCVADSSPRRPPTGISVPYPYCRT